MARHSRHKIEQKKQDRLKVKTVVLINSVCILVLSIILLLHLRG